MSALYLGTDPVDLAARLAAHLDDADRDWFMPVTVVVPNPFLGKWLRLWLARRQGIVINLRFTYLESALWELLRAVDPRKHDRAPELVDAESYELLVLASLMRHEHPDLAVLQRHFKRGAELGRPECRRAWSLARRLATAIRDYEYHRQDALIQRWLKDEEGIIEAGEGERRWEPAQRALFRDIVAEGTGRRARLGQTLGKNFRTLPQYAMELLELLPTLKPLPGHTVHIFGVSQMSALHTQTLHWLGRLVELNVYHLNPLLGWLDGPPTRQRLQHLRDTVTKDHHTGAEATLLRQWGRAGAESLWGAAELLADADGFRAERVDSMPPEPRQIKKGRAKQTPAPARPATVLARLQDHLHNRTVDHAERMPQDKSLQIVGCPGIIREVETVYQSILHNLNLQSDLRQSDVAVLVTDMGRYRPALQAVFEREPRRLKYNLIDTSAAGLSRFGQALIGMLDLALESFSRTRVLEVLLNPCFLARLGVTADDAQTWPRWIEQLGMYQAWDTKDKAERGYAATSWFSWKLGLQRLRLGRFMDPGDAAARFGDVAPFADLASSDRARLDAFSRAVEGLLPTLADMRRRKMTAEQWAQLVRHLIGRFLDVPEDRPEEKPVRDAVLAALDRFENLDGLSDGPPAPVPLALVREYLASNLEQVAGQKGEPLTGGVTLAGLVPMRPVPFELIYVLGLGEDAFPGSNQVATLDLRGVDRQPGDIRAAEQNRFLFLETILSARQKLYLLYNNRDLHKDKELFPCVPMHQLRRFVSARIVQGPFQETSAPLSPSDTKFIDPAQQPRWQDVLVQYQEVARCLALADENKTGLLHLDLHQQAELADKIAARTPTFAMPVALRSSPLPCTRGRGAGGEGADALETPTPSPQPRVPDYSGEGPSEVEIKLGDLKRFLGCPALASLRRHLHVADDEDEPDLADDEPFVCGNSVEGALVRDFLHRAAIAAWTGQLDQFLTDWPQLLQQEYGQRQVRGQAPEGAFAIVDRAGVEQCIRARLEGTKKKAGLVELLRALAGLTLCGPLLLGNSLIPLEPRRRFPASRLALDDGHVVYLHGSTALAWHDKKQFAVLVVTSTTRKLPANQVSMVLIEPVLLYLALIANTGSGPDGVSARDWLAGRDFVVHLAGPDSISTITYPAGSIAPEQAEDYLRRLVTDFLDDQAYDLLPLEVIVDKEHLRQAYASSTGAGPLSQEEFHERLEEAVEEARENPFSGSWSWGTEMEEVAGTVVPLDALVKVRRRFALLDIGPALVRMHSLSEADDEDIQSRDRQGAEAQIIQSRDCQEAEEVAAPAAPTPAKPRRKRS